MPPPMQTLSTHSMSYDDMSYLMDTQFAQYNADMKWYNHPSASDHKAEETNAHSSAIQPSANLMNLHKPDHGSSGESTKFTVRCCFFF